jgi:hypothetical protein
MESSARRRRPAIIFDRDLLPGAYDRAIGHLTGHGVPSESSVTKAGGGKDGVEVPVAGVPHLVMAVCPASVPAPPQETHDEAPQTQGHDTSRKS